ncbi:S-layer homology domain-containing protein [Agathobaculum sp.]|uniref:S-layer homology domain-containing protein n=1 Tax=Agathobaculum sp. TaxID=2048138 RepID=UPI002A7F9BF3|nr:S-layer homology domain-containing protein [Agathobaculum sp.]MDY3617701.1 S-layer homology domain-containing protein [Agathobaculum sp.]
MKNLKKVLALVLAFACAFTMFAGAAFTDSADINSNATEAVDTLSALGVIKGYTDGSFQPNGTITRAEAAKMLYVLRTGSDNADAYKSINTKFTDLNTSKSSWAAGYIKYCESLGIIAGKSATKFDPDSTVTGQELAKMLLVTLGYGADKAQLVGSGWGQRATALADENGILDDVTAPLALALPREFAALMMFNAVNAPTVVWRDDAYTNMKMVTGIGGDDYNDTIGEKYMGLVTETVTLSGVVKEDNKSTYQVNVTAIPTEDVPQYTTFTKVVNDYSALVGQKVKLLHKKDKSDVVYGITAVSGVKTVSVIVGDLDAFATSATEIKANGTTYKLEGAASGIQIDTNRATDIAKLGDLTTGTALQSKTVTVDGVTFAIDKASTLTLIDNNDNGKYDLIVATPHAVGKVTFKGADSITVNTVVGFGNQDNDDVAIGDGIAKDSFVEVTPKAYSTADKFTLTKLDVVEGTASSTRATGSEVRIDGTWYTHIAGTANSFSPNSKYKLAVLNGYVYDSDGQVSTDPADYVYVAKAGAGSGLDTDSLIANLYFADGTTKSNVVINSVDDKDVVAEGATPTGTEVKVSVAAGQIKTKLCTFTEDGGEYDLEVVAAKGNFDDYNGSLSQYQKKKLGSFEIADDATIFVDAKDSTKVLTGKQVKAWGDDAKALTGGQALTLKSSGFQYVQIAAIQMGTDLPDADNDTVYGYLTDEVGTSKEGNTTYYNFTIWNGTDTVEVSAKSSNVTAGASMSKGDLIEYKIVDDATINGVKKISATKITSSTAVSKDKTFYEAAVAAFDGSKIRFYGDSNAENTYDIDSDTYQLFINSKDTKGAQGEIDLAQDDPTNTADAILNAVFAVDSDGDVIAIIVDVNGNMGDDADRITK